MERMEASFNFLESCIVSSENWLHSMWKWKQAGLSPESDVGGPWEAVWTGFTETRYIAQKSRGWSFTFEGIFQSYDCSLRGVTGPCFHYTANILRIVLFLVARITRSRACNKCLRFCKYILVPNSERATAKILMSTCFINISKVHWFNIHEWFEIRFQGKDWGFPTFLNYAQ